MYEDRTEAQSHGWLNLLLVVWSEDGGGDRGTLDLYVYTQYKYIGGGGGSNANTCWLE